MGYRVQQYRVRRVFIWTWVFLVVVVAIGFYIQARTIASLHTTQDDMAKLIAALEKQNDVSVSAVCDITFALHPDPVDVRLTREILLAHGIDCSPALDEP